jgi:eukaryotic-like serine/threonine-protein kinase
MPLGPGSRLDAYELLQPLGAGGMGEVWLARDTRLNRDVAIKVLPADRLADEHRRRRFHQEARVLSSLNHPHIVTIYEVESAGDMDFMVMEVVPGSTLDLVIPSRGLPLAELLRIAVPVTEAGTATRTDRTSICTCR